MLRLPLQSPDTPITRPPPPRDAVWATGVLAYELLHGYPPFMGSSREETESFIATAPVQVSSALSAGARDFVLSCLHKDPALRPTVPQLLAHPWIRTNTRQLRVP